MTTPELDLKSAVESAAEKMFSLEHGEQWGGPNVESNLLHYRNLASTAIEAALPHLMTQISDGIAAEIRAERNAHISVGTQAFGAATQAAVTAQDYGSPS